MKSSAEPIAGLRVHSTLFTGVALVKLSKDILLYNPNWIVTVLNF